MSWPIRLGGRAEQHLLLASVKRGNIREPIAGTRIKVSGEGRYAGKVGEIKAYDVTPVGAGFSGGY